MHGRLTGATTYPGRIRRILLVCGLGVAMLSGCHDSPSDPLAAITTVETVPSLALSSHLPAVADLAHRLPGDEVIQEAVRTWKASWDREDGASLRNRARAQVVPVVHDLLGISAARTAVRSLDWLRETPELAERLPPSLGEPVAGALLLLEEADQALEAEDGETALHRALAASDQVRAITPEAVARRLLTRGQRLLDSGEWDQGDLERARHLVNGARRAIEREDYDRAIQRAFYACQVLEGVGGPAVQAPAQEPPTEPERSERGGR